jgi:acyl dehydratase
MTVSDSPAWTDLAVGDELPGLALEMTATHIVAGAVATRDFMPVHHDRDYANAQGAPDIFMNILSSTAHCSRWLTDWAGPDALVRHLAIRLGVPVTPGTSLTFGGTITDLAEDDDEGRVDIDFRATTDSGDHLTGTATVTLPLGQRIDTSSR